MKGHYVQIDIGLSWLVPCGDLKALKLEHPKIKMNGVENFNGFCLKGK
jgi:hypothetical protein